MPVLPWAHFCLVPTCRRAGQTGIADKYKTVISLLTTEFSITLKSISAAA